MAHVPDCFLAGPLGPVICLPAPSSLVGIILSDGGVPPPSAELGLYFPKGRNQQRRWHWLWGGRCRQLTLSLVLISEAPPLRLKLKTSKSSLLASTR